MRTAAALIVAGSIGLFAAPALACVVLTPNGTGSTNIRRAPTYYSPVKIEAVSGWGDLNYCGTWRWDINGARDDNGNTFKWLQVLYMVNGIPQIGWVASVVVSD